MYPPQNLSFPSSDQVFPVRVNSQRPVVSFLVLLTPTFADLTFLDGFWDPFPLFSRHDLPPESLFSKNTGRCEVVSDRGLPNSLPTLGQGIRLRSRLLVPQNTYIKITNIFEYKNSEIGRMLLQPK